MYTIVPSLPGCSMATDRSHPHRLGVIINWLNSVTETGNAKSDNASLVQFVQLEEQNLPPLPGAVRSRA
jgi:hypothetical protein